MANEVQLRFSTGKTLYYTLHNQTSGYIWSMSGGAGGAMEAFTSGNWTNYALTLTEQGVSAFYAGNIPSALGAGVYSIDARQQTGGSAAQTDPGVATGDINWNGSQVLPLSDLATSGQIGQIAPIRLARGVAVSGFPFKMVSSTDHVTPFTSGVVSGQIARDGGSFGALQSGAFTEMGLGFYRVNLTSGDVAATTIALSFSAVGVSGGAADNRDFTLITQRVSGF